ncbi:hypothetical protein Fmac_001759 [Flemingia macrophylla]|uniref:Uncharacterized protein n=1 Tax=Flemingia macrophylla TaxID=520843 RepID=A0ABD1NI13_9FABA
MLRQPSKIMDMEYELRPLTLRAQLSEKTRQYLRLQKELSRTKKGGEKDPHLYELEGIETLQIQPCSDTALEVSNCSIQCIVYHLIVPKKELISVSSLLFCLSYNTTLSEATESVYAPEPFDVGRILQAAGLGTYVEALMNGSRHPTESIHVLHLGKMRMKLCKGRTTIAKEYYSSSMQIVRTAILLKLAMDFIAVLAPELRTSSITLVVTNDGHTVKHLYGQDVARLNTRIARAKTLYTTVKHSYGQCCIVNHPSWTHAQNVSYHDPSCYNTPYGPGSPVKNHIWPGYFVAMSD